MLSLCNYDRLISQPLPAKVLILITKLLVPRMLAATES